MKKRGFRSKKMIDIEINLEVNKERVLYKKFFFEKINILISYLIDKL